MSSYDDVGHFRAEYEKGVDLKGIDIRLHNTGDELAFVTEIRLLIYPGLYHPAPCAIAIRPTDVYDFPIDTVLGFARNSAITESDAHMVDIGKRLEPSVAAHYPLSWRGEAPIYLSAPVYISQVTPAHGVDRFQIVFRPHFSKNLKSELDRIIGGGDSREGQYNSCAAGTNYPLRLVLIY